MNDFKLEISGFKTKEQVEAFMFWYEGQGEQDACVWFECRNEEGEIDVSTMNVDMEKTKFNPVQWDGNVAKMVVDPM